jgi:hypothetical protein
MCPFLYVAKFNLHCSTIAITKTGLLHKLKTQSIANPISILETGSQVIQISRHSKPDCLSFPCTDNTICRVLVSLDRTESGIGWIVKLWWLTPSYTLVSCFHQLATIVLGTDRFPRNSYMTSWCHNSIHQGPRTICSGDCVLEQKNCHGPLFCRFSSWWSKGIQREWLRNICTLFNA